VGLILSWTSGSVKRRPARLVGAMIGVGLSVALLACLGAFIDSSVETMTGRAIAGLPIDWQILLSSRGDEEAVRAAIRGADPKAVVETVVYADVPGLIAKTGGTVQMTGAAAALTVITRRPFPLKSRQWWVLTTVY
jgi:putative ABC transport system permease protein